MRTAGELSERYEYTPEGLLKSAISGGMRYSYTYDTMGRLREKDASGRKLLAFVYDRNGNVTGQEDVTGKVTEYRYNLLDQVTEVWDSGKRLAAYTYNPDGTVRSIKNGNSLYTEYAYDADKNLTGLLTKLEDDTIVENHYLYDGNGNRTEKQQLSGRTIYEYDSLNRLSRAEYPGWTEELFYDKAGNRTGRVAGGAEERYYYDKRNRLTAQQKNGVHTEFQYDAAGNLVKDGKAAYTYDAFNRNTRVETFDGNIQINRYDAEGLRHEMEENGKLVQFIFRGTEVVSEETQEEKIRYIRAGELLASDAESARTYYHYASDEMGSITHVTAGNEILNRYEYDAWGNAEVCEEQVANRFRFNGQQYDLVSQQYYLRARFYNPVIARFTQEDTYRGDGLNLYAYCRNNPVYYVDPSGYICDPAAQRIMEKLASNQATRNEQKKLAAYLRNKDRHGGLTDAERGALQQVDSYTYLPRYENQTLPWKNNKAESKSDRHGLKLSRDDTIATIKSIRRYVQKTMKTRVDAQELLKQGRYERYGTYFHARVFKRVRMLDIHGLMVDKNIYRPGTQGGKGNIRRPDFQWQKGTPEYEIWDLKPNGYEWEKEGQYQDMLDWTGLNEMTQLNYNR